MDPTSAQDILQPGQEIGGSTIEAFVASGGMGVVYKAHKKFLERTVALKVLKPHLAAVPSFLARFLREGKVASRLEHPGIVKVYDLVVAQTSGGPGIASEVPAKYVYDYMFQAQNLGQGFAASTMMLLTVAIIIIPWAYLEFGGKKRG